MNNVIIIDNEKKSYTRLFFDFINNTINVNGYNIIENQFTNFSNNELELLKDLFFPDNLFYKMDSDGYKVFADNDNLLHYFKDGKEDFLKFLQSNDLGAYLYDQTDYNQYSMEKNYRIHKKKKSFIIKVTSIAVFLSMLAYIASQLNESRTNIFEKPFDTSIITTTNYTPTNNQVFLSSEDLIRLISESQISEEQKEYLSNKDLFDDVINYYKGTIMEILISEKLNGLQIKYFNSPEENGKARLGYYSISDSNTIYLNENYSYEYSLGHEFVHLLQNPSCSKFFAETTADIVAKEYFGLQIESYKQQDYLLKLLINTIGPVPVWEYTFGGDISSIDSIIRNNLSADDYEKLFELLFATDSFSEKNDETMEMLIGRLYLNLNNENIKNNHNIFDSNGNLREKSAYFNVRIMKDIEQENGDSYDSIKRMFPTQFINDRVILENKSR